MRRTRSRRPAAAIVAAVWAVLLLGLAAVGPALAVEGPTKLDNPKVTPRSGTTTTTIAFEVRYRNREGSAPDHINVLIDGTAHRMSGSGTTWKSGVVVRWSTRLPAGTHTVRFEAADTRRFTDAIGAGSVTIAAPSPTPRPTPTPTPKSTPTPTFTPHSTPTPTPQPTPKATPGSSNAGGSPGGASGGNGSGDGPRRPGSTGGGTTPGGAPGGLGGFGTGGDSTTATGGSGSSGGAGGPGSGSDQHGARSGSGVVLGWGDLARALEVLGVRPSTTTTVLPMLVGTTTATAMAFAFAIFGKKRRDEEPPAPDEVLQAHAARGHGDVPGSEVVGVVRPPMVAGPIDAEAGMPRWRRPSLMEARKADPSRFVAATTRMSFENGSVSAVEGRERRVIRYRVVRLLDAPDELRSVDIGQLDQGDEVQLLERSGAYWLVLCPDGRQGWLHKMTLGEVVTDEAPEASWTPEVDDDVLTAFLAARARA
jgi:uncharacterized membrane protein YgcG